MSPGLWMPPAVVVGGYMLLWGATLLDRLVAFPPVAVAPVLDILNTAEWTVPAV